MSLLNFNSNNKSWKMYTNTITSIANDDLLIKPNNTNDLILEVSANNNIFFKKGDISYSINTKIDSIDISFGNVYTTFGGITSSFTDVNTKFLLIDASFNNKLASISGNIIPLTDICYNLGSDTKAWANAYIRDISVTNISASGNIIPFFNLSGSLGSDTRQWANAYIKDISGLVNINGQPYGTGSGSGTMDLTNVTTNINPSIDNSGSLGISNRIWGNAFIHDLSISSIDVSLNLNPLINNNGSLGTSNRLWGNAYINNLSISSIDVSVNNNPLTTNSGSLGSSTRVWNTAHIINLNASSITTTTDIVPLTDYTGSLGVAGTNYLGSVFCNRLYITHHNVSQTGSIPSDSGGVGLLIENLNTSANQRAIIFLRTSNSSLNSRAAITIVIGYAYAWQISVRQESPNNTLFFHNSEIGTGQDRVIFNNNGSASCTGTFSTSDDRLKHNEIIINNGLTIIDQLVPKFYQKTQVLLDANYKGDLSGYTWFYEAGLIAQELLQIKDISFLVEGGDYYDSNNVFTQQPYSVCYGSVFIYGLAAIKELHTKVKTQESSIVNLQSRILNQQTIINSLIARIAALKNKVS